MNFILDGQINKAEILFPGVGCFLIAFYLRSSVHASNAADNNAKLSSYTNDKGSKDASGSIGMPFFTCSKFAKLLISAHF